MNYNLRFACIFRFVNLIFIILLAYPLSGQQIGSEPAIVLVSPSSRDSLNNSGMIVVQAEITSLTALNAFRIYNNDAIVERETSLKPVQKDSVTYLIESLLYLKEGKNVIYVQARNSAGRANSEKRIILSRPEPFIVWCLPSSYSTLTKSGMIKVRAEIKTRLDLLKTSINLNGIELTSDKQGITRLNEETYDFEKTIQLNPGKNTLFISAANLKGTANSANRYITMSSAASPPVINLLGPSLGDSLNNSGMILVRAEIISDTPLEAIRIFNYEATAGNENTIKTVQKDSITSIIACLVYLNPGENMIYVQAKNAGGKTNSEKRIIKSQPEPFIIWHLPASVDSSVESGTVTLNAEIKTRLDLIGTSINLNGIYQPYDKEGITRLDDDTYKFEKTIHLYPGKNILYLTASNTKGFTNSESRSIRCPVGSAPIITLLSPSISDSLNNSGLVQVNAEIISGIPLQNVRIFLNRKILLSETDDKLEHKDSITSVIKSVVSLQSGINTIYIDAKSIAGTASSEKRIITCKLEPMFKWILPTPVDSAMDTGMLTIRAEIKTSFDLGNARIILNGVGLELNNEALSRLNNDTYVLEKEIQLSKGGNSIILTAVNAKGTGYSSERYISYVPGLKSEIHWTMPANLNSECYKSEINITATIITNSEIKGTNLSVNGTESGTGGSSKLSGMNATDYLYENTLNLKPGINSIVLSVLTDKGTISSEERAITFIEPALPVLEWRNPVSDQITVNSPSFDIIMGVKSFAELESMVVFQNGQALENIGLLNSVRKENEGLVIKNSLPLSPGDNSIYIVAGNAAGRATSETRNVKYIVPSKPVIIWDIPERAIFDLSTETITVKAKIISKTILLDLKIFQNDKALIPGPEADTLNNQTGEYLVEKTIVLNQGENRIYIFAENNAGSCTSETRSVNYIVPASPSITWVSPSRAHNDVNLYSAEISASIRSFEKLQSVLVYVNGKGSEVLRHILPGDTPGEYKLIQVINLQPGENNIYLSVTNKIGTTNSDPRYLTNPTANPPLISWTIPTGDSTIVNSDIVVIEACIKSPTGLKSAQIYVNGIQQASEMTFQAPQSGGCNYVLSKSVVLKEGDNSIFVIAENFAGSNRSDKRLVRYQTLLADKRLALVIGNSDYENSAALRNPVNDANLMEGTLKTLGFTVIKRINATKNEMFESLRDFSNKLSEFNVALFYYAGHGVQVDGQNYLIPTDAVLKETTDCKWEALRVNDIIEEFEKVPENINVVILDACRNNPFRSWSRGGAPGFRAMNPVSGTLISYATAENSTAADGPDKNGTFTEELVKQMNIPQSIYQVFNNTRKQVLKRTNNMQRPTESNNLTGDFYFKK